MGKYPNGDTYIGEWRENSKNGVGLMYFGEAGSKYKGDFKKGKIEGKGLMKYKNGDMYEGEFRQDLKEGCGKY